MIEIQGKYNKAKVFTDNIDSATISQITGMLNQEFIKDSQVRIQPDCHSGTGCVIGTTMTIKDKVVPNLVGVDIGCLDRYTEVLTETGWVKISEYNNQKIMVYDQDTDKAYFDYPNCYIKNPCDNFYHFKGKFMDMMLSSEHHVIAYAMSGYGGAKKKDFKAEELYSKLTSLTQPSQYAIKTTFDLNDTGMGIPYSDFEIRLIVMLASLDMLVKNNTAILYIPTPMQDTSMIDRAEAILKHNNIAYHEEGNTLSIRIKSKYISGLSVFYKANKHQLQVLCDEVKFWGAGYIRKSDADVVQYAYAVMNKTSDILVKSRYTQYYYGVHLYNNTYARFGKNIDIVPSTDGYKYCFNTKTGAFIARRNNKIFVTGNCGMLTTKLDDKSIDLDNLDKVIHKYVPSGFDIHDSAIAKSNIYQLYAPVDIEKAYKSLGTLGGGNHFIEVDKDEEGNLYLVIHTGSRHLGIEVCTHYQQLAYDALNLKAHSGKSLTDINKEIVETLTSQGRQKEISKALSKAKAEYKLTHTDIPYELAYLEGSDLDNYLHDMQLAQEHARINRQTIVDQIIRHAKLHPASSFDTVHNYIDIQHKILRKGSISARQDEIVLIPLNMRDGSLICRGKGNPDWNYSAPHGAGRIMSRSQAKETISMQEYKDSMQGIYTTCVAASTVDESPMAYKPSEEIIQNIKDTVDIVSVIKPIYNFKAC